MTCLRRLCMEEEYFFFFTWREALFCFKQMTWQRLLTFAVIMTTRHWMEIVCNMLAIVASSKPQQWNLFAFSAINADCSGAGRVQVRGPCSLTHKSTPLVILTLSLTSSANNFTVIPNFSKISASWLIKVRNKSGPKG